MVVVTCFICFDNTTSQIHWNVANTNAINSFTEYYAHKQNNYHQLFVVAHFVGLDMTYTYWADRCPNRYADRCVKLDVTDSYKWRDTDCAERLQFFCEKGRLLSKPVSAFRSMLTVRNTCKLVCPFAVLCFL